MNECKNCGVPIPIDNVQVGGVHMACEYDYYKRKEITMYKYRPLGLSPWIVLTQKELVEQLEMVANDDDENCEETVMEVLPVLMSKHEVAELEKLPEFQGW